jgi:polyhydroxybutyrate depolymerase
MEIQFRHVSIMDTMRVMRLSFLLTTTLAIVCFSSAAQAQSCNLPQAPGVSQQQVLSGQRQRPYRLFVPPGYDGRTPLPLVLDLHPSGGTSDGQARTSAFEEVAAREGFAVASPQAVDGRWNVPVQDSRADDVVYINDVIDHAAARLCIDLRRIYATGFSGGGRMSSLLACKLNTRIAAFAPVAAIRWPAPCGGRAIPVLAFHGLADPQNPYEGKVEGRNGEWVESVPEALDGWAKHNGCRPDVILEDPAGPLSTMRYEGCRDNTEVRLIRIDGLRHAWPKQEIDATSVMWQFFKNHRLPQ